MPKEANKMANCVVPDQTAPEEQSDLDVHCLLRLSSPGVVGWCRVNFQCPGVLLIWIIVGQRPTALAVGTGGACLDIFSLVYLFFFLPLWKTA